MASRLPVLRHGVCLHFEPFCQPPRALPGGSMVWAVVAELLPHHTTGNSSEPSVLPAERARSI